MKIFHLRSQLWLARPRTEVFEFFSNALNLETITPPWLNFHVLTPQPIHMHEGTEIEYRLKLHSVPLRWKTRINLWDPPNRFVDEQIRGPYRLWIHEHKFAEDCGRTTCEDHVQYAMFGGTFVNKLLVERDVRQIFAYRSERLRELFPPPPITAKL